MTRELENVENKISSLTYNLFSYPELYKMAKDLQEAVKKQIITDKCRALGVTAPNPTEWHLNKAELRDLHIHQKKLKELKKVYKDEQAYYQSALQAVKKDIRNHLKIKSFMVESFKKKQNK